MAAALLLSGCGADGGGSASSDAAVAPAADAGGAAKAAPPGTAPAGAGGAEKAVGTAAPSAGPTANAADRRYIAYTGRIVLEVKAADLDRVADAVRGVATGGGGFVGGESLNGGQGGPSSGRIELKVPSARFQQAIEQLAGLGTVLSRSSQADDMTQQVVDTESRLKTQQASVDRVRALLADAKTLSEVVSLESELTRREADLESLKRQQQELAAQTSLSTITVELRRPSVTAVEEEEKPDGLWTTVADAFRDGWRVLWAILRGLLIALAALSPFVLLLAPVAWLVRRSVLRRRRTAPPKPPGPVWPAPAPGPRPQGGPGSVPGQRMPEAPQQSDGPAAGE
ncbi:DUF4349 domain-containing protein [Kitasatospora sp. NBC_01539]|uniref:DUF4349 domain-containing protein n=1 Tax=Kitasatospora sp. NBC_01539 TaxID=2903577 RepID=UPI0038601E72